MVTRITRWIGLGVLVAVFGNLSACAPLPVPPEGGNTTGGDETPFDAGQDNPGPDQGGTPTGTDEFPPGDQDGGIQDPSCTRTVDTVPSNVFLSTSISGTSSMASGASTGLGRALRWMYDMNVNVSSSLMLYEVGSDGQVLAWISLLNLNGEKTYMRMASEGRFTVGRNCLSYESEMDYGAPPWVENGEDYQDSICGLGRFPLWQTGRIGAGGGGEYICLEAEGIEYCPRCWQDEEGWHQEMDYTVRYTARGTLDVFVQGQSGPTLEWVTVSSGESIVVESSFEFHYLISPSPEELGYQAFEMPTWP